MAGGKRAIEKTVEKSFRVNERIFAPQIRVIGSDGRQLGIMSPREALEVARGETLDLIEVAPSANPPVCKIMDYGRYRYEQRRKDRDASKKQRATSDLKMMRFPRVGIGEHDLQTKAKKVREFLAENRKVRVTLWFRGRERAHPERGKSLLERVAQELADVSTLEVAPAQDGRNMTMTLAPKLKAPPTKEHRHAEDEDK